MKKAFITGITGQDGSYMAELLLRKGYEVHGLIRRSSSQPIGTLREIYPDFACESGDIHFHYGDLSSSSSLSRLMKEIRPDEVYNLGAMSDVRISFDIPEYTADVTGTGLIRILEAVRLADLSETRVYQASTSEIYGKVQEIPQKETTPFYPRSPYAASKLFAHWICKNYREAYGMFICSGFLFNHESPRRGPNFVTRKIAIGLAKILAGQQEKIVLGNLDAKRDWGYAPEYVEAMWQMMQQEKPDDYVIATGESHSVREFLDEAFGYAGLDWTKYVEVDERFLRPTEADILIGDASKAQRDFGWKAKVVFKELVRILVDFEINKMKQKGLLSNFL
ncbi:MAG: GDP-mannose 4,6-dehydratase [Patescibacteria group bacterium]